VVVAVAIPGWNPAAECHTVDLLEFASHYSPLATLDEVVSGTNPI